jgi:LysM repeat protein
MRIIKGIKTLMILSVFITFNYSVFSQVVVVRSKEKVIISGSPYYMHQVKKGETAYSISRAYNITVEELTKANPPAVYGVNEGQSLIIPVKPEIAQVPAADISVKKPQKDETKFIYHSLQAGETIYSLSKANGVSENEIIQSNPGIDINKLSVGAEIAIPRRVFMSDREKFDDQDKQFFFHKVEKGESLASIAEKYGFSVRELRKVNRDLRFPQVGDFVRIPGVVKTEVVPEILVKKDSVVPVIEPVVVKAPRPAGYTDVKNLNGTMNVAVLLPFYLRENAERTETDSSKIVKGKKQKKTITRPEEWIYQRSFDFVEMYNGILLAADTLRALGLNVNISTWDIKSDTSEVYNLINSGKLAEMNLVIGPVYSHNLSIVANYCKDLGIPVVSPVTLKKNSVLTGNPTLFMANSSLEVAQKELAKRLSENYNKNIVFIHADSTRTDPEVRRLKELIFSELNNKLPYEEIKFKEFLFYSRSMFDNDSINRLSHALSDKVGNVVVIASEDPPVISETISEIHGLSKRFDIKVFGYPSMLEIDNLDTKIFFDLDLIVNSTYRIDYSAKNVQMFNAGYRHKFFTEPLERSYAWLGFDIGFYFLSGMAMYGKDFINDPSIHYPDLLETRFDFVRKEPGAGFENQKLFLVRYTKDYDVILINDTDIPR